MSKYDISDGFYHIDLRMEDMAELGVTFPTKLGDDPLVAFPLVLPMGRKNSPPIINTFTETTTNLANQRIYSPLEPNTHLLDN